MTNPTRTEIMQGCVDGTLAERFAFAQRLLAIFDLPECGIYVPPLLPSSAQILEIGDAIHADMQSQNALQELLKNVVSDKAQSAMRRISEHGGAAPGQLFHVEHVAMSSGQQLDLLDRDAPPVVHDVVLPPLPVIATDWFPIADADYARPLPERIGYYELRKRDGGAIERRWFNGTTWSCAGGTEVWVAYDGWRGCTTPAPLPAVEVLPSELLPAPETKWLEMDGSAQPELPTLSPQIKYYNPELKKSWGGRGKVPAWMGVAPHDSSCFAVTRAGSHMVDVNGVIVGKVAKK